MYYSSYHREKDGFLLVGNADANEKEKHFVCHDIQYNFEKIIEKNIVCLNNSFFCFKSKFCINSIYVCDGEKDCHFNEDEENCQITELANFFQCDSTKKMIFHTKVCDFVNDCSDQSDEKYCSKHFNEILFLKLKIKNLKK